MKKLRESFSKRRYVVATIIILVGIVATPFMVRLAYLERGHRAIGGEYGVFLLAILMVSIMLEVLKARDAYIDGKEVK